jgi:hypothetical protein
MSTEEPKKRGRKKKTETVETPVVLKKRGRKPKGGKVLNKIVLENECVNDSPNIILHLKCSIKDIESSCDNTYNPVAPPEIKTYDNNNALNMCQYTSDIDENNLKIAYENTLCRKCNNVFLEIDNDNDDIDVKDINNKLKELRVLLFKNELTNKKSACFWCTYEFDNPECYIPKYETDDSMIGYGSFCRPECAVGYLMKENLDDSTKFERYQLLNKIYGKIYNYEKNIKPAPDPYYLLDKYYGNLNIQEYRKLLKTQHMMIVIDKPLTRILPELHEDSDEFILNMYGEVKHNNSGGVYKVKRQSEKKNGPTKNSIIKDTFGIN